MCLHVGDLGSIHGLERSPEEGKSYPLQYSDLENSMDCIGSQRVGHDWVTFTLACLSDCMLICVYNNANVFNSEPHTFYRTNFSPSICYLSKRLLWITISAYMKFISETCSTKCLQHLFNGNKVFYSNEYFNFVKVWVSKMLLYIYGQKLRPFSLVNKTIFSKSV